MRNFLMRLLIVLALLLTGADIARASSTEIRARILAVRIIVVNDNHRITQIYQNSDQEVAPDVRLNTPEGSHLEYYPDIARQDQAYRQKLPSLIETLYAML